MKTPVLVRNVYSFAEIAKHGFEYISIGRPDGGSAESTVAAAE